MARKDIIARLKTGDTLILDGAISTELKRRGIIDSTDKAGIARKGITKRSALAIVDAPGELQALHEDYLRAGAEMVTTNTYNTNRAKFFYRGIGEFADRCEEFNRRAVEIALAACEKVNPSAFVAGSVSPPYDRSNNRDVARIVKDYRDQARVLVDAGVDVILLEYHRGVAESVRAVDAVAGLGAPVILAICNVTTAGSMESGESFTALASALSGRKVAAILTHCSRPESISASISGMREAFKGPVGAYPNAVGLTGFTPEMHAEYARDWISKGAQIVGGCCGTTPEHIAAIQPLSHANSRV